MSNEPNNELTVTAGCFVPKVSRTSLVGIHSKDYPLSFGNYCWIWEGPYLVNCWAENLEEWARRNKGEKIWVTVVSHKGRSLGVVTDERMKGWTYDKLCITGHGWISMAVLRKIEEMTGADLSKEFCGCEKDDESPDLGGSWSKQEGTIHRCRRCERTWRDPVKEENEA